MDAAEVVEREVECQRVNVIVELLAESVGQPGEAAVLHADRKVHALDMRRADMGN